MMGRESLGAEADRIIEIKFIKIITVFYSFILLWCDAGLVKEWLF